MHQDVESIMFTKEQLQGAARGAHRRACGAARQGVRGQNPADGGHLEGERHVLCRPSARHDDIRGDGLHRHFLLRLGRKVLGRGQAHQRPRPQDRGEGCHHRRGHHRLGLYPICALLDKYSRRVVPIEADYKGFDCADEFVVGFGLDYAERYRNLPYIGVLKRSVYEK